MPLTYRISALLVLQNLINFSLFKTEAFSLRVVAFNTKSMNVNLYKIKFTINCLLKKYSYSF